jgi:Putative auto-transporter adhesin, head GIN domain
MKNILYTFIIISLFSCQEFVNQTKGNGQVTTTKREVTENFTKIETSEAIAVEIEQAENNSIEVETDSNLQNHVKTTISNGVLKISLDKNMIICEELIVRVKIKELKEIETTSASSIKSVNTIKGNSLNINATSASEIDLEAEYETITIDASSTGDVTIKGKTLKLETNASSASSIDASELMSNEVFAKTSSVSDIKVYAIVKLDAKAESAGTIASVKRPRELRNEETSGGEITIE